MAWPAGSIRLLVNCRYFTDKRVGYKWRTWWNGGCPNGKPTGTPERIPGGCWRRDIDAHDYKWKTRTGGILQHPEPVRVFALRRLNRCVPNITHDSVRGWAIRPSYSIFFRLGFNAGFLDRHRLPRVVHTLTSKPLPKLVLLYKYGMAVY